jgi:SnoaL-like domain
MKDVQIRTALERHWTASAAGDQDVEHEIYHDEAIVEYPQSGECIRGRHNVQALRSQHPDRPSGFVVRRIVGAGDFWVTEYVITYDGHRVNTVSIMEFQEGKVVRETQYFAEPFEPPAWRAQWVERMK